MSATQTTHVSYTIAYDSLRPNPPVPEPRSGELVYDDGSLDGHAEAGAAALSYEADARRCAVLAVGYLDPLYLATCNANSNE